MVAREQGNAVKPYLVDEELAGHSKSSGSSCSSAGSSMQAPQSHLARKVPVVEWQAPVLSSADTDPEVRAEKDLEEDEVVKVAGIDEMHGWTYKQYIVHQQHLTMLDAFRCTPIRDGQHRLLLAGLAFVHVGFVLLFINAGGFGSTPSAGFGPRGFAAEGKAVLAALAICGGVLTLCYCAALRRGGDQGRGADAAPEASEPEVDLERAEAPRPHRKDYRELLRLMKLAAKTAKATSEVSLGPRTGGLGWRYRQLRPSAAS